VQRFFEPRSVVLIGVSRKVGPGAYNNLATLLNYGYPGRVYLVHPKIQEILGHPTYHHVADLPEVILALSRLAVDYPEIRELDLNPVIADPQGCWAVDCRVVIGLG
jgi:hypothetical protein